MERYLLFDGHCSECSDIARAVRKEAGGRLEARSLHDPVMRALVERARPDARLEPVLLEVDADRVRVFSGLVMRARIGLVLGPRRSLRVARMITGVTTASTADGGLNRRTMLARTGAVAGLALFGVGLRAPAAGATSTEALPVADGSLKSALRNSHAVASATRRFGEPDWTSVQRMNFDGQTAYLLRHPSASDAYTYTLVGDPTVASAAAVGLSYRIKQGGNRLETTLMTPGGRVIAVQDLDAKGTVTTISPDGQRTVVDKNGKVSGSALGVETLDSHDCTHGGTYPTCMRRCMAELAPTCTPPCLACMISAGGCAGCCLVCGACGAAGVYGRCAFNCRGCPG